MFIFLEGRPIDTDLRKDALALQRALDWEDEGPEKAILLGGTDTGNFLMPLNSIHSY